MSDLTEAWMQIAVERAERIQSLEAELGRVKAALREIGAGEAPPEPHGHYTAHRACVDIARRALNPTQEGRG